MKAPSKLPMIQEKMIVVVSSNPIVQGSASADHVDDRCGIVGDRVVEVEAQHVADIGQILLPERLVETEFPSYSAIMSSMPSLDVAPERRLLDERRADGILAAEPGQEEVDRRGQPDDRGGTCQSAWRRKSSVHGIFSVET